MTVIKDIDRIIDWYMKSYAGASISQLMDAKSKLLTLCYRFSEETASSKRDSIISTVFRKAEHHKIKSQLIEDGYTLGLAESKTIEQIRDIMSEEAEREALSIRYKLVLDIALRIAEDLTQRISVLKKEYAETH